MHPSRKRKFKDLDFEEFDFAALDQACKKVVPSGYDKSSQSSEKSLQQIIKEVKFSEPTTEISPIDDLDEEMKDESIEEQEEQQDEPRNLCFNDGKRIFINRLKFYPKTLKQENLITFRQLMNKTLSNEKVEVKAAILTTYLFDLDWLNPLIQAQVPITVFVDRAAGEKGPVLTKLSDKNANIVKIGKFGEVRYGVFHSKLILYEFDDRLRVIISSANLCPEDWLNYSQVIWFQDFYRTELQLLSEGEFRIYLEQFLRKIIPLNVNVNELYRQKIDMSKFDFSEAAVRLVASMNGIYRDKAEQKQYGLKRMREIL